MRDKEHNENGQLVFVSSEDIPPGLLWPEWALELKDPLKTKEVLDSLQQFIDEARSYDRNDLLGLTGLYSLNGGVFSPGSKNTYPETVDIEFLQAVTVQASSDENNSIPRERVSAFWHELRRHVFVLSHEQTSGELSAVEAISQSYNANYRNPYGDDFFDAMVLEITSEYDQKYVRDSSVTKIGRALVTIRSEILERFKNYCEACGHVLTAGIETKLTIAEKYLGSRIARERLPEDETILARGLYSMLEDRAIGTLFTLDDQWIDLHEQSGLPMRFILAALTTKSDDPIESNVLLKLNPVWERPFTKTPNGYALFSVVTLMSYPFSILMVLLGSDPQAKARLEKIRGIFCERHLHKLLSAALPSANIVAGGFWKRHDGNRAETDLILFMAGRLLIFEVKGALLPERAKLGTPNATKHFLRRVWGKSTRQGQDLAERIESSSSVIEITDDQGAVKLILDPEKIVSISRYSVSIEQLGLLMNSPSLLKKEGVLDDDANPAPCIILSELNLVLDDIEDEIGRLHYLARRGEVAKTSDFIGDELDFFSTYLQFGFSSIPRNQAPMMLLGASYHLKSLRDKDGQLVAPKDSSLRNSSFFQMMLTQMRASGTAAYPYVALLLFDLPLSDQLSLEKGMAQAANMPFAPQDWPIIFSPMRSLSSSFIVAGMFFNSATPIEEIREAANNVLKGLCVQTRSQEGFIFARRQGSRSSYDALYYRAQKGSITSAEV